MRKHLKFLLLSTLVSSAVHASSFPSQPVSMVVPNPPGGLVDTSARLVSDLFGKALGGTVVVENKDGGSGNIAYRHVAKARPDGHTLLVSYSAYHVGNPALTKNLPWAPADFVPVGLVTVSTNVIAVHPSIPGDTLQDLIKYLKEGSAEVNYASQGVGSLSHIGTEIFKLQTGTNITHIPYRGSGAAIQDVVAGNVQIFITTPPSVMGYVQGGQLKGLAVASDKRHPMLPEVPTTAEAGLPEFTLNAWVGIFAPRDTPEDVLRQLSAALETAVNDPAVQERAAGAGIEARFEAPDVLQARVDEELAYWAKTIEAAGIQAE